MVTAHSKSTAGTAVGLIRMWWHQDDHYDWIIAFLREHKLIPALRFILVGGNVSLVAVFVALTASNDGLQSRTATVIAYVTAACGIAVLLIWLVGVPSKLGSICYAAISAASLAIASLLQTNPLVGFIIAAALTTTTGYTGYLHTPRVMLANLVFAVAVAAVATVRLGVAGHWILALGALWVVAVVNIGGPLSAQVVVHTFGIDLLRADRDPLTGLLNRRGFNNAVRQLFTAHRGENNYLAVIMIDLDRFKLLNDTHGHAVGDQALVAVAAALQTHTAARAVIARAGGEEFLVAEIAPVPEPVALAEALREAIAAGPYSTTASVGTASISLRQVDKDSVESVTAHLASAADLAMYQAKRAGGNQIRCAELDIERS